MRGCWNEGACITVDSAVAGKRERIYAIKLEDKLKRILRRQKPPQEEHEKQVRMQIEILPSNWDDVEWFQKHTSMKIVIKGVQTGLDAVKAARAGCDAVILSNHGGRNLDTFSLRY